MILSFKAVDASIANSKLKSVDQKLRRLFKKLKSKVAIQLKITPWVKNNGALELYLDALEKIKFVTFADVQETVKNAVNKYKSSRSECIKSLNKKFSDEYKSVICEVIAVGEGNRILDRPLDKIRPMDRRGILEDKLQMFNSEDDMVYVGNDFMLLENTNYSSDLYGSIGFSLTHEILHTLVFDQQDIEEKKPLAPFWTKNAGCVEEQTLKTCETFPTVSDFQYGNACNSKVTFEEDAADLAAYRIVWDVYEKAYGRKTTVADYESLNKRQLFFYGAAVFFCKPAS
uniref:Peptidase_M13 domain-containing protein n=1 Tax=Caenorhabditis tropicalis TaxID=1561998 RepID=A0A1I7UUC0_9PELO